jgi:hypothetical protein
MTDDHETRDAVLATIDQALDSGRVTATEPEDRELQELALALEAESPLPDDDFVRLLDIRVAEGFPRRQRRRTRGSTRGPRLRALALTGAAASFAIAIALAAGLASHEERSSDAGVAPPRPQAGVPRPAVGPDADFEITDESAMALSTERGTVAPDQPKRRVERSAELTLAASNDKLESVADSVVRVADRHGGFVATSAVTTGESPGGRFDLRIPVAALPVAIRDLSQLAHVRARSQAGRDVTPAFVTAQNRFDAARAERRSLLRRLENATTDREANRIRTRLDFVSERVERWRRSLGDLRERTNYATVAVTLTEGDGGGAGPTREALDDGLGLLGGSLNVALRALGILLPVAVLAGLSWLARRMLLRRRRESALQ